MFFFRSADRAKTGSWSWKPYSFKKKQVCNSELRFIRPGYARDSTGKWQVIVQTEDLPQRVAIDLCHEPHQVRPLTTIFTEPLLLYFCARGLDFKELMYCF